MLNMIEESWFRAGVRGLIMSGPFDGVEIYIEVRHVEDVLDVPEDFIVLSM